MQKDVTAHTEGEVTSVHKIRIILHGKQAANENVRSAVATLRAEGHAIEVRVTWEAGDTMLLTQEAVQAGVETVVAAGGDGTINEVVRGLIDTQAQPTQPVSLGILPLGTANDFARSCSIPADPLAALRLIVNQQPSLIDVGQVEQRFFLNMATGGFGTQITVATPEEAKRVFGGAAYLLTGLSKFSTIRPSHGTFRGPDFTWSGEFMALAIGNGRQAGGGHILCPDGMIDDGLLDVNILPAVPPTEVRSALNTLLTQGMQAIENTVVSARVAWVEIDAPGGLDINLDGEPIHATQMRFVVLPTRLPVHMPSDVPLLLHHQEDEEH